MAHVGGIVNFDAVTEHSERPGYRAINLGTGKGTTVRELLAAFSAVIGEPLRSRDLEERPGDIAGAFTRSELSADLLGWPPKLSIESGIRDALQWRVLASGRPPTSLGGRRTLAAGLGT